MIDLAEYNNGGYIPLKAVAERQQISLKYLEQIMMLLNKANLIDGVAGKGGGYRLNRDPDEYVVGDILRVTERDMSTVTCFGCKSEACTRTEECRTHPIWEKYQELTNQYFDSITIADLLKVSPRKE